MYIFDKLIRLWRETSFIFFLSIVICGIQLWVCDHQSKPTCDISQRWSHLDGLHPPASTSGEAQWLMFNIPEGINILNTQREGSDPLTGITGRYLLTQHTKEANSQCDHANRRVLLFAV